jgi:hypothetical protein
MGGTWQMAGKYSQIAAKSQKGTILQNCNSKEEITARV